MKRPPKEDIITLPHSNLRKRSRRVGLISPDIKAIINQMKAATLDWEANRKHEVGVALAAVQIDQLYRIVVIRQDFDDKDNHDFNVFINPVITKYEGKMIKDYEGCLSVIDVYGHVPRYEKVRIKALDENGRELRLTAEGFLARIFQHEIDHTNGILFVDHIKDTPGAFFSLDEEGQLTKLNYEELKASGVLW